MKKLLSFLLIIFMFNMTFCFAEDDVPRGTVTLRWEYVQASVGGYAIYIWDGYAYREVDRVHQDVLEWNSDEAKIYPKEETLAMYEANSVTQNLFTAKRKGERLRNNPNGLYRVMKDGTEHSYDEYKDCYLFKIGTINEYGEVVMSAPIVAQLDNWNEAYNVKPEVSISINNGAGKTTDNMVDLKITATDDTTKQEDLMMRFANDKEENWSSWEKFSDTKSWELSEGYGEKTVFVEIKDFEGLTNGASDKIELEELKIEKIDLMTSNGAHATKEKNVVLIIEGVEDIENYECWYSIDGGTEKVVEINNEGKIDLELAKENKNKIDVRLRAKNGTKTYMGELVIWRL